MVLKTENPKHIICIESRTWEQYLWTWRQSVEPNDAPRDFGPEVAFGTNCKVQIPVARQWGREVSASKPYVTNPFHPLSSLNNNKYFPYLYQGVPIFSSKWYGYVCLSMQLRMCFSKTLTLRLKTIIQVILISILYVLARRHRSATTWCPPIKSLSLFVMKRKDKRQEQDWESHYARKRPGKTLHILKMAQFL